MLAARAGTGTLGALVDFRHDAVSRHLLHADRDFFPMFRRTPRRWRESPGGDRMAHCANTLHDIVVKIS